MLGFPIEIMACFSDQHPTKRAALSLLRKNCDFVRFLFDCALKNCHRMNQSPTDLDLKHLEFLFGLGRSELPYNESLILLSKVEYFQG